MKEKGAGKLPRHCERQQVSTCAGHLVGGAIPKKDAVSGHGDEKEGSCREVPDTSSSPLLGGRKVMHKVFMDPAAAPTLQTCSARAGWHCCMLGAPQSSERGHGKGTLLRAHVLDVLVSSNVPPVLLKYHLRDQEPVAQALRPLW